jgi:transporter family protein
MKPWLLSSLITLFLYGLWGFFPKLATRTLDARTAVYAELSGIIAASVLGLLIFRGKLHFHVVGFCWAAAAGFVGIIGSYFFLKALSQGKASIVVVLTSLYPVLVLLFAFLFLRESITLRQGFGIALAIAAVALLAG